MNANFAAQLRLPSITIKHSVAISLSDAYTLICQRFTKLSWGGVERQYETVIKAIQKHEIKWLKHNVDNIRWQRTHTSSQNELAEIDWRWKLLPVASAHIQKLTNLHLKWELKRKQYGIDCLVVCHFQIARKQNVNFRRTSALVSVYVCKCLRVCCES